MFAKMKQIKKKIQKFFFFYSAILPPDIGVLVTNGVRYFASIEKQVEFHLVV